MSKTKPTKKHKLNPLAIVALVLCALIAVYCGTTAWLTSGSPINPFSLAVLEDFVFDVRVKTSDSEEAEWESQTDVLTFTVSNGKLVTTKTTENTEEIELAKYRFNVAKSGNGVAFVRFRISQEWLITEEVNGTKEVRRLQGAYNMPFIVAENDKLFDNRANDGYVYYKGAFPADEDGVEIFSGFDIANFDTSAIPSNAQLKIDVTVDAVQFNRYQQFWGIDALPWR